MTLMDFPIDHDYPIRDTSGTLVAIHRMRYLNAQGDKTGPWLDTDGNIGLPDGIGTAGLPLFRSEYLSTWTGNLIITEGEKAAAALALAGYHALGTVTGASGTPSPDILNTLRGHTVTLWPDNDEVGLAHMDRIANILHRLNISVSIVGVDTMPKHGDAADVAIGDIDRWLDSAVPFYVTQAGDRPQLWGAAEIDTMYAGEVERLMQAKVDGRRAHLSWGFDRLDSITDGLMPGLVCMHAPPGVGKSAFALQVAAQVDAPVLYVSAEMSVRELVRRIVSRLGNVNRRTLMSAGLSAEDEMEIAREALEKIPNLHFLDATVTPTTPEYIGEQLMWLKKMDDNGHALLIIDSLHSWIGPLTEDLKDASEYDSINAAMVSMRALATKYSIPVLFIAERNRASMKEGGLSAVAGSRAPEYRSDTVLSLDLDPDEDRGDTSMPHNVFMSVLKNRNGPPGARIAYLFDGDHMRFCEIS
jgi:hypothetical protein